MLHPEKIFPSEVRTAAPILTPEYGEYALLLAALASVTSAASRFLAAILSRHYLTVTVLASAKAARATLASSITQGPIHGQT